MRGPCFNPSGSRSPWGGLFQPAKAPIPMGGPGMNTLGVPRGGGRADLTLQRHCSPWRGALFEPHRGPIPTGVLIPLGIPPTRGTLFKPFGGPTLCEGRHFLGGGGGCFNPLVVPFPGGPT